MDARKYNPLQVISAFWRSFWSNVDGSVSIIAALTLPIVLGIAALSLEYGTGLLIRAENQRVADMSSYSAAIVYSRTTGDPIDKESAAILAGESLAALNGINPDNVIITFPLYDGSPTARATITTQKELFLSRIISEVSELEIEVSASTLLGQSDPGYACILGLETGEIDEATLISGNVNVSLGHCAFGANNQFRVNGNPTIDAACTSPLSDDTDAKDNCNEWNQGGPFDDPYKDSLVWDTVCAGREETLGDNLFLAPGLHCINQVANGNWGGAVTGDDVILFFDPGMLNLTIAGNKELNFSNSRVYAPGTTLDFRGTVAFTGINCNGIVSKRIILRGNVTLSGECTEAKEKGLDGTPQTTSIRLVL